jgi:hypothetical protein
MNGKKKSLTIPRGYRLKPATHRLIKGVQKELKLSQQEVISSAITYYYNFVKDSKHQRN